MNTEQHQHLNQFLTTFKVTELGEGDPIAGVNTLTTMLCTLANIARPGSGIESPHRKVTQVGANLLITGSLSSSLVNDDVINQVRRSQNNLTSHLERSRANKESHEREGHSRMTAGIRNLNNSNSALDSILNDSSQGRIHPESSWSKVTAHPPNPNFDQITKEAKVVVSASKPSELERQLQGSHLSHPLVLLGLSHSHNTERMASLTKALIDGRLPDGTGGKTLRGNLIVTDADDVLRTSAKAEEAHFDWLNRLIWLADSSAGPEVPGLDDDATTPTPSNLGNISNLYHRALQRGLGQRLDHKELRPVIHQLDITDGQARWVDFLKEMEDALPGISGTARSLLATLVFGIRELTSYIHPPVSNPSPLHGIEPFARFLIHRMANTRSVMACSAQARRDAQLQYSIIHKLKTGPHTLRELIRRFNRMTSEQCLELLEDLEVRGYTQLVGNCWRLTEANHAPASIQTLEV